MNKKELKKILVADDEPSLLKNIKGILQSDNYEVVTAKNGREAIEKFKKESPDLVILDVSMPYYTGFEVLERIKKYFKGKYIPVIFLTVSVEITSKLKALHGGAVDYMTKPASPQELLARVKNFLLIKHNHDTLQDAAIYDWMTGVLNKSHFMKRLEEELGRALRDIKPISLIFFDIDHFKNINDKIGHLAGDAVIKEFAKRLKKYTRTPDIICRFGGDEFILLLPNKSDKEAIKISQRFKKELSLKPVIFERKKIKLSASMGIAVMKKRSSVNSKTFLKTADEALYETKAKGGNNYCLKII